MTRPTLRAAAPEHGFTARAFTPTDLLRVIGWSAKRLAYCVAPLNLLFCYATAKGTLLSFLSKERNGLARRLFAVFGKTADAGHIRRIVRHHFVYLQKRSLVCAQLPTCAQRDHCRIQGLEHLDLALSRSKGAILLTAHFGYGRLIKHALRLRQYPAWLVGPKNPHDKELETRKLTRFGRFVYLRCLRMPHFSAFADNDLAATPNVRSLVHALKRNDILVLTVDGVRALKFMSVSILGQTVPFATGSISLARASGAMVLPTFVVDSGSEAMDFALIIEEPVPLEWTDDHDHDVLVALERVGRVLESYVRAYPHLYSWPESDSRKVKASTFRAADRYRGIR